METKTVLPTWIHSKNKTMLNLNFLAKKAKSWNLEPLKKSENKATYAGSF